MGNYKVHGFLEEDVSKLFLFVFSSYRIDCGRYPKHSDESHHSDPAQVRKYWMHALCPYEVGRVMQMCTSS